jgi:hypothetical protein
MARRCRLDMLAHLPDGPGWVRITVIDRNNDSASAEAWLN